MNGAKPPATGGIGRRHTHRRARTPPGVFTAWALSGAVLACALALFLSAGTAAAVAGATAVTITSLTIGITHTRWLVLSP